MPRRDQHDRWRVRVDGQPPSNLEPVEIRKLHIDKHEVRVELLHGPERGGSVAGLADHLKALRLQKCSGEGAETRVVVNDENRSGHASEASHRQ